MLAPSPRGQSTSGLARVAGLAALCMGPINDADFSQKYKIKAAGQAQGQRSWTSGSQPPCARWACACCLQRP